MGVSAHRFSCSGRWSSAKLRGRVLLALTALLLLVLLPLLPLLWPLLWWSRWYVLHPSWRQRPLEPPAQPPPNCRIHKLSHGDTFVQWDLPPPTSSDSKPSKPSEPSEPWIVLIHGNMGSTRYLDELAAVLTQRGRRVLRYDLHGRGYSACGGFTHTWQLFVGQLAEVLFAQRVPLPVDLVGYSIGAQVAGLFCTVHAHAVRSVVLLCPAVVTPAWLPTLLQIAPLRWLVGWAVTNLAQDRDLYAGDWLHLAAEDAATREASLSRLRKLFEIELDRFRHEPALARTFGLSMSSMPFDQRPDLWRALGESARQSGVRVHALCAERDAIVPGAAAADFLSKVLGESLHSLQLLAGHGHSLPYESPDECTELLLGCLGDQRRT